MAEYITWDEFELGAIAPTNDYPYMPTNILCPRCYTPLLKDISVVLTTYPAQHRYECKNCGWSGTR